LELLRCSRSTCNQRQAGAIPIGALVMVEPIRSAPANGWMVDWLRRIDRKRRHVEPKPLRLSIARTVESSRSIASMCPKTTYTVPLVTEPRRNGQRTPGRSGSHAQPSEALELQVGRDSVQRGVRPQRQHRSGSLARRYVSAHNVY